MNIISAAMSIYLLFPILYERQQNYSEWIGRNQALSPQEIEKRLELIKYLSLEDLQYENSESFVLTSSIENEIETLEQKEITEEVYLKDSYNHLKLFRFGEEKFFVGNKVGDCFEVVSVNNDVFSRKLYDSSYRLIENIVWKNKATISESTMIEKTNWNYLESPSYMTTENFINKTFSHTIFNQYNLPIKISFYNIKETEEKNNEEKMQVKLLSKIRYLDYDQANRIVLDKEENYELYINNSTGKQKNIIVFTTEKKYLYKDGFELPDLLYYEDEKLTRQIEQIDDKTYFELLFFPEGTRVQSKFENGTKVEEKIILYGDN